MGILREFEQEARWLWEIPPAPPIYSFLFTGSHQRGSGTFCPARWGRGVTVLLSPGAQAAARVCDKTKAGNMLVQRVPSPLPSPYMSMLPTAGSAATTPAVSPGQTWGSRANFGNDCGPAAAISLAGGGGAGRDVSLCSQCPKTLFPAGPALHARWGPCVTTPETPWTGVGSRSPRPPGTVGLGSVLARCGGGEALGHAVYFRPSRWRVLLGPVVFAPTTGSVV